MKQTLWTNGLNADYGIKAITWSDKFRALLPYEIIAICRDRLGQNQDRLLRQPLGSDQIVLDSSKNDQAEELDSVRDYLGTVEQFIYRKAVAVAAARKKLGLPEALTKNEKGSLRGAKGEDTVWPLVQSSANESYSQSSKRRAGSYGKGIRDHSDDLHPGLP